MSENEFEIKIAKIEKKTAEIEKKALRAIKISLVACGVAALLGILSLWVLLNQVTVSVGIDKKLISIEKRLGEMDIKTKD